MAELTPDGFEIAVWSDPVGDPLTGQFCPICKQPNGIIQVVVVGTEDKVLSQGTRIFVCGGCRFTASIGHVDLKTMREELLAKALRELG